MWGLPGPGIKPVSPALAGWFFTTQPPGKPTNTHCFLVFSFLLSYWMWSGISLWFDLHFPNLLWRNVFSDSARYLIGLSSSCQVVSVSLSILILDPYQIYDLQVFSLVLQPSFYFLEVPLKYKVLRFDKFVCLFLGFVSCAFHIISKNHCQVQSHKKFSPILFFYTVLLHSEIL